MGGCGGGHAQTVVQVICTQVSAPHATALFNWPSVSAAEVENSRLTAGRRRADLTLPFSIFRDTSRVTNHINKRLITLKRTFLGL